VKAGTPDEINKSFISTKTWSVAVTQAEADACKRLALSRPRANPVLVEYTPRAEAPASKKRSVAPSKPPKQQPAICAEALKPAEPTGSPAKRQKAEPQEANQVFEQEEVPVFASDQLRSAQEQGVWDLDGLLLPVHSDLQHICTCFACEFCMSDVLWKRPGNFFSNGV